MFFSNKPLDRLKKQVSALHATYTAIEHIAHLNACSKLAHDAGEDALGHEYDPRIRAEYKAYRRRYTRIFADKSCLCDVDKYRLIRMSKVRSGTGLKQDLQTFVLRVLIVILRTLCLAIRGLIRRLPDPDVPAHTPAWLKPGVLHDSETL